MIRKSYAAVILASLIAGVSGAFIKVIQLPSTSFAAFRSGIPLIIAVIILMLQGKKLFRGKYRLLMFASVINAARMYLFFIAYLYTTISNAVIVLYTWPIFVTLFSMFFLKEKVSKRNLLLLGLAFLGILVMYSNKELSFQNHDFIGMSAALITAAVYAITVIIYKKESDSFSTFETIFYQNLVSAVIFVPFLMINEPVPTQFQVGGGILYGALMGLAIYGLFFFALKHLKASSASFMFYLELISAILIGVVFFGDELSANLLLGGAMIIAATLLMRKNE